MSDAPKIKVKPATNPETGKPFYTWHPDRFRQPIPAEGALVPHDIFTRRYINDGMWIVDEAAPAQGPESDDEAPFEHKLIPDEES